MVTWPEGSSGRLSSRFARLRVRTARRGGTVEEEWLLIEWPKAEKEPTKYWLSTLPHDVAWARMVDLAKLRWRIERDYQESRDARFRSHRFCKTNGIVEFSRLSLDGAAVLDGSPDLDAWRLRRTQNHWLSACP